MLGGAGGGITAGWGLGWLNVAIVRDHYWPAQSATRLYWQQEGLMFSYSLFVVCCLYVTFILPPERAPKVLYCTVLYYTVLYCTIINEKICRQSENRQRTNKLGTRTLGARSGGSKISEPFVLATRVTYVFIFYLCYLFSVCNVFTTPRAGP